MLGSEIDDVRVTVEKELSEKYGYPVEIVRGKRE